MSVRIIRRTDLAHWAQSVNLTTPTGPPVPPSDYIDHADHLPPGTPVVLHHRASDHREVRSGAAIHARDELRQEAERRGFIVKGEFWDLESGRMTDDWEARFHYSHLRLAAERARELGAVLLALSTDRFARGRDFDPKRPSTTGRLSDLDLRRLVRFLNCRLATVQHPDATPAEIDSEQKRRGHRHTTKRDGRPPSRTTFRLTWLTVVVSLRERGLSYHDIATEVSNQSGQHVSANTVRNWILTDKRTPSIREAS